MFCMVFIVPKTTMLFVYVEVSEIDVISACHIRGEYADVDFKINTHVCAFTD